jgi:DNA topoisomerase-1
MSASPAIIEAAESAGLHYTTDSMPGISRRKAGKGWSYRYFDGRPVRDAADLDRIRKLAIPPAYRDVWICMDERGHLQATGLDARGRKQYRYHPDFRKLQDENKFKRMLHFGQALPKIREGMDHDLRLKGFPERKVLAVIVYLLEKSLIRVGNEEYAKENKSFGLTTMRTRHVSIHGEHIEFNFLGKSKIKHRIDIHDRRLARVIKKLQELPGQELFQYLDDSGKRCSVSSSDVNAYLQELSGGEHFTAKDFRTWWGTVLALTELSHRDVPPSKMGLKKAVTAVMKAVSQQLGNTPAICRKSYVHPVVLDAFEHNTLRGFLKTHPEEAENVEDFVRCAEAALIDMLQHETLPANPDRKKKRKAA